MYDAQSLDKDDFSITLLPEANDQNLVREKAHALLNKARPILQEIEFKILNSLKTRSVGPSLILDDVSSEPSESEVEPEIFMEVKDYPKSTEKVLSKNTIRSSARRSLGTAPQRYTSEEPKRKQPVKQQKQIATGKTKENACVHQPCAT